MILLCWISAKKPKWSSNIYSLLLVRVVATLDDSVVLDISDKVENDHWTFYSPLLVKNLRPPLISWKTMTKSWTWTIVLDIGVKVKSYHWTFTHVSSLFGCWRCLFRDFRLKLCWIWVTKSKMIIEHLLTSAFTGGSINGFCTEYQWQSRKWSLVIYSRQGVVLAQAPFHVLLVATIPYAVLDISDKVKNDHWTFTHLFFGFGYLRNMIRVCWAIQYPILFWISVTKLKMIDDHWTFTYAVWLHRDRIFMIWVKQRVSLLDIRVRVSDKVTVKMIDDHWTFTYVLV